MTERSLSYIVKESAEAIGLDKLAARDLRRTYARPCHGVLSHAVRDFENPDEEGSQKLMVSCTPKLAEKGAE